MTCSTVIHLCFSLSVPQAWLGFLDLGAQNCFLAEAMSLFSTKGGLNLNPSFFYNCLNHYLCLSCTFYPCPSSCLMSLSSLPPFFIWWESIWCQRLKKSKLSSTLFIWKGWWLEPKDRLHLSLPALMMVFTFSGHCCQVSQHQVILIPFPYSTGQWKITAFS